MRFPPRKNGSEVIMLFLFFFVTGFGMEHGKHELTTQSVICYESAGVRRLFDRHIGYLESALLCYWTVILNINSEIKQKNEY